MEFRIDPTPISKRRSRRIVATTAVLVVALAAVVGALAVGNARPGTAVAPTVVSTTPPVTEAPAATPLPKATALVRTGPAPRVVCHAVADPRCEAIARAALAASDDPALPWPSRIDVWASLLCGSDFDCPPDRMTGRSAAGSAVVMAGTVGLWVNVVEPATGTGTAPALEAWVIRSGPIG